MNEYIGRKLDKMAGGCFVDIIKAYGFIEEQCNENTGAKITFDRRSLTIKKIEPIQYMDPGFNYIDDLPEDAKAFLDRFIRSITTEGR